MSEPRNPQTPTELDPQDLDLAVGAGTGTTDQAMEQSKKLGGSGPVDDLRVGVAEEHNKGR